MSTSNHLVMNLLRIITPEEVGEITTKHNGGKFISLTELINERVHKQVYRNFAQVSDHPNEEGAKILPFRPEEEVLEEVTAEVSSDLALDEDHIKQSLNELAKKMSEKKVNKAEHAEDENMSTFILIEKARLKKSQQSLKQKEILELYQKNRTVDIEQIKGQEDNMTQAKESGVLVNKRHY